MVEHRKGVSVALLLEILLCVWVFGSALWVGMSGAEGKGGRDGEKKAGQSDVAVSSKNPPKRILLWTHPTPEGLVNIEWLFKTGALSPRTTRILAVYHTDMDKEIRNARKKAGRNGYTWIRFERITCRVEAEDMRGPNDCTAEFRRLFQKTSGAVFSGGPDIPPSLYGEKTGFLNTITTPKRHVFELSFLAHLLSIESESEHLPLLKNRPDYPVLGICLGMQSMNVALGGTLVQDVLSSVYQVNTMEDALALGDEFLHRNLNRELHPDKETRRWVVHRIRSNGSWPWQELAAFQDKPFPVLSSHHQAVNRLGEGLVPLARTEDEKVLEAFTHRAYPNVLGVQFHPEYRAIWVLADRKEKGTYSGEQSKEQLTAMADFSRTFWNAFQQRLVPVPTQVGMKR